VRWGDSFEVTIANGEHRDYAESSGNAGLQQIDNNFQSRQQGCECQGEVRRI